MNSHRCRFCSAQLLHSFCDLGMSPLSNAFIKPDALDRSELFHPLHARVCDRCWLVQLPEHESPERIFDDEYAYFSSYSDSWLAHARDYEEKITSRFGLGAHSLVVEVASNDGYLLQYFVRRGIPVLGIEPAGNCAAAAERRGVPTRISFFGAALARELVRKGHQADLLLGNNVLAHVPDLNDFVAAIRLMLRPRGVVTLEIPHLLQLIGGNQFDTIYHEHYSYFSLRCLCSVLARHGLTLFDVEELPTHGGSLRIYGRLVEDEARPVTAAVDAVLRKEQAAGLFDLRTYAEFGERIARIRRELLGFLIDARNRGLHVVGYGAPAKGNTLLNYCGVRPDLLEYTVDRSPHKQGRFLPGTRIPVYAPEKLAETEPDRILILPWNLRDEIVRQLAYTRNWGAQLVVPIPRLEAVP